MGFVPEQRESSDHGSDGGLRRRSNREAEASRLHLLLDGALTVIGDALRDDERAGELEIVVDDGGVHVPVDQGEAR